MAALTQKLHHQQKLYMAALTMETESPAETVVDYGGVSSLIVHFLRSMISPPLLLQSTAP